MKVIAICTIDEEILKNSRMDVFEENVEEETVLDSFQSEFGWLHDSGISMEHCYEIDAETLSTCKMYQIFLWRKDKECYVPIGNPLTSKILCKNRLKEAIINGWIPKYLSPDRFQIREHLTINVAGPWKEIEKGEE